MDKTYFIQSEREPSLELIYSDIWLPGLYSRRILCFELPTKSNHEKAIEVLKRSLQSLVNGTPEFGGIIEGTPPQNGRKLPWKAIRPYKGLELIIKDLRASFQSFSQLASKGFPVDAFPDDILMPVPVQVQPYPNPETKVQLSLIEGGMLLSFCAHHSFTDGNDMNAIMAALGEECRRAAEMTGPLPARKLDTDRTVMANVKGSKTSLEDHPAYGFREGAWLPHSPVEETETKTQQRSSDGGEIVVDPNAESTPPRTGLEVRSYRITASRAEALKQAATSTRISTHDAIIALMWRTMITARYKAGRLQEDDITTFTVPHNARRHVGLDKNWVGNCVYFIVAFLPVSLSSPPAVFPRSQHHSAALSTQ